MLIKLFMDSLDLQGKYFYFSWFVILVNRLELLSLMPVDVAIEDVNEISLSMHSTLKNLILLGIQANISP